MKKTNKVPKFIILVIIIGLLAITYRFCSTILKIELPHTNIAKYISRGAVIIYIAHLFINRKK